ncbi:N-acetylneuraminate synthase [Psychrosphaera sp. B3R10]|uniref:N-acetylneuraminate synthase n=1 Tax=unclassified Psychrosphaera TaxID=2641570 RepID=UPI001C0856BE|nr:MULTISPECIES: N-acetylneuraminate synthase [unclassified Psychrosphaera]MBU2881829.1 N-acetylneuraminate synthase [Psychrosphaera sp. I2R16]MBU2989199.1 N-acetylneuraminate synthase [Psychrosphaera sp. B3R10]MDO6719985.1 N-acetylneuraminate synthase [Psychrosphaera sp. 1_MG-2023]
MTLIIAEAGVNHNGSEELAFKLVDEAFEAGADIVKFQTFKAKNLVTDDAKQADYQISNTGKTESQYSMLKRLELSFEFHHKLIEYCNSKGIEFLSTAFDSESLSFLVDELGLKRLKIPSGEITNAPLVLDHARTGCELIVSTGMATMSEIEKALSLIAFGYLNKSDNPTDEMLENAYFSELGKKLLKERVTILHCTSEYPAPYEDINLNAMTTIKNGFKLPVGYSDHSEGITVPIAAVAKGAVLIEKHFTCDKNLPGPDHKASLDPEELTSMISAIRIVEKIMGDGIKGPRPSELKNRSVVRKSLVAATDIVKGELITSSSLCVKRPGDGVSPYNYWKLINTFASKDYKAGSLIDE